MTKKESKKTDRTDENIDKNNLVELDVSKRFEKTILETSDDDE
jgi:hypothetical protein